MKTPRHALARTLRATAATLLLAIALLPAGCDWGPEGEGEWRATLTGPGEPFGSAVLLVTGEGIQDVTGDAGVRVWIQETDPGEFRAVLVQTEATGSVHFRIRVQDMAAPPPSVAVLEAADLADEQVQVTEAHRARLQR